ncbi:hypothetical protein GCM10007094_21150 [Pseudovibrio japonicus]|uniref:HPt domain-containing protein n=1 Tax=Pseudovibrio japonicus TaxID=366534 RepID=A0ABQ3EB08_9HYPH|nr:Hpt domain-containing protein [Pseudovibrio japonicus]GHB32144.1 hypothetical protein GCM10007094_21150 [Pseudovibrio japonicus]
MTFDDPDLQGQILEAFAQQIEEFRRGLQENSSPEAFARLLHRFKGSARGVGAFALGDALERAEHEIGSGQKAVLADVETCLEAVSSDLLVLRKS